MEERFFFDGIHVLGAEFAVYQAVKGSSTILADIADAAGAVAYQAAESAQTATYVVVVLPVIEHGFFHGGLLLHECF
jgi:hypothetical protein